MESTSTKSFSVPQYKKGYLLCFILALAISVAIFVFLSFIPDFIGKPSQWNGNGVSLSVFLYQKYFSVGNAGIKTSVILFWIFNSATFIIAFLGLFILIKQLLTLLQWRKWWGNYVNGCSQIINSCDVSKFTYKVAMVVCTCNDVLPNTIKQSANQTYKNMDVWVSDDSTNPQIIEQIDKFCNENGYHVLHRDPIHKRHHPTKIGNLYYFLEKYGDQYDYIFENDSSSLVTQNFVENGLCFFNSPLLDHTNDGGLIANGSFTGIKTLLPYLYSRGTKLAEASGLVGSTVELCGHPAQLNGWGALYKTSTLRQIPLEKVECPSCDMTRGLWLTIHNCHNYLNPFDFTTKLCPPNAEGIKNQWLKWTGGDVFSFRQKLSLGNVPKRIKPFVWIVTGSKVIILPATFIIGVASMINILCLNFIYFNVASIVLLLSFVLFLVLIFVILCLVNKLSIKSLILFVIFYGLLGAATGYKIACQTFKCFITKKWSSGAVTIKGAFKATPKQKIKMGRFEYLIILIALTICTLLHIFCPHLNRILIWAFALFFMIGPSILYLLWIWIGDIQVRKGWSPDQKVYNFWDEDFRYKLVKQSSIWQKQNNVNKI